jgi:hypothetical protein
VDASKFSFSWVVNLGTTLECSLAKISVENGSAAAASPRSAIRNLICRDKEEDYRIRRHNSFQKSQEDVCLHWPHQLRTDDSGTEIVTNSFFYHSLCFNKRPSRTLMVCGWIENVRTEIQTWYTVKYKSLMPYNKTLHVSVHQNHHRVL